VRIERKQNAKRKRGGGKTEGVRNERKHSCVCTRTHRSTKINTTHTGTAHQLISKLMREFGHVINTTHTRTAHQQTDKYLSHTNCAVGIFT
jgi:hypothetical protein